MQLVQGIEAHGDHQTPMSGSVAGRPVLSVEGPGHHQVQARYQQLSVDSDYPVDSDPTSLFHLGCPVF